MFEIGDNISLQNGVNIGGVGFPPIGFSNPTLTTSLSIPASSQANVFFNADGYESPLNYLKAWVNTGTGTAGLIKCLNGVETSLISTGVTTTTNDIEITVEKDPSGLHSWVNVNHNGLPLGSPQKITDAALLNNKHHYLSGDYGASILTKRRYSVPQDKFIFYVTGTQTIDGVFRTLAGQTITVDWGDGTSTNYSGTTDQVYTKNYGAVVNRKVTITNKQSMTKFTATNTTSNIWFNLNQIPAVMTYFTCNGHLMEITGNLSSIPAVMTTFTCNGNLMEITGNLSSIPAVMTYFYCSGNLQRITGNLSSMPAVMTTFICSGNLVEITGNLSSIPAVMTYFTCNGNLMEITGNLSSIPAVMTYFYCSGSLITVTGYTTRTLANNMRRVYFIPGAGYGLTASEIDQLLIDLANVATWVTEKSINISSPNAARTSASDAAFTTLTVTKGVAITPNL